MAVLRVWFPTEMWVSIEFGTLMLPPALSTQVLRWHVSSRTWNWSNWTGVGMGSPSSGPEHGVLLLNQTATAEADLPMSNFDMAFSFFPMGPCYGKQNRLKSLVHPETFRGLTDTVFSRLAQSRDMSWSFHVFKVAGKRGGRCIPAVASFIRTRRRWVATKMAKTAGWWPVQLQRRGTSPAALWELYSFQRVVVAETWTVGWSDCRVGRPLIAGLRGRNGRMCDMEAQVP